MGKIKEGKGPIIGNAGEYLVAGELLKRGVIAALTPRNSPGFDVLATNGIKSVNIRVKTKTTAANTWVWICKKDEKRTLFKNLSSESDFTVLVDLRDQQSPPEYYVLPTVELDRRLRKLFDDWFKTPSKGSKPHNPSNRMYRIGSSVKECKGAWSLILNALETTSPRILSPGA